MKILKVAVYKSEVTKSRKKKKKERNACGLVFLIDSRLFSNFYAHT